MGALGIIRKTVKIADLVDGMTVEINGNQETVSNKWLKQCQFMGWTYKGDTHRNGITRIIFVVPTAFGFRYE